MRSSRRFAFGISVAAVLLSGCGGSSILHATDYGRIESGAPTHHQTFNYVGTKQTFVVPAGVRRLTVSARGGEGGGGGSGNGYDLAGLEGRVYAVVPVQPGDKLDVFVGGGARYGAATGGFNGGGDGGSCGGSAGGGASDVRMGGDALKDRIIVAAGGGGAGGDFYRNDGDGGDGGGSVGKSGGGSSYYGFGGGGTGGTQSNGGLGGIGGQSTGSGHNGKKGHNGALGPRW